MASLGKVYNREEMPVDDFAPIPAGVYTAIIESDEKKQSKKNPQNSYLNLKVRVVEGRYKNSVIFNMLNLWNDNPKAAKIAEVELGKIMDACKKPAAADSSELHNIPVKVKVAIQPGENGYNDKNIIKDWMSADAGDGTPSFPEDKKTASPDDLW